MIIIANNFDNSIGCAMYIKKNNKLRLDYAESKKISSIFDHPIRRLLPPRSMLQIIQQYDDEHIMVFNGHNDTNYNSILNKCRDYCTHHSLMYLDNITFDFDNIPPIMDKLYLYMCKYDRTKKKDAADVNYTISDIFMRGNEIMFC